MKRIEYDRETNDYSMYWNDQYIGSRRTRREAEAALDLFVYDYLRKGGEIMDHDDLPDDAPGGDDPETGPYAEE